MAHAAVKYNIEKDIDSMLKKYDNNNDSTISWDEAVKHFTEINSADPLYSALCLFRELDTDNDGKISLNEIEANKFKIYSRSKKCGKEIDGEIKALLKLYDADKNGKISWDEALSFYQKNSDGSESAYASTKYLFDSIDKNGDREISRDELLRFSLASHLPSQ